MTQELTSFADLNLSDALLKALDDLKFVTPSPVQQQTIPLMLQRRDLIAQERLPLLLCQFCNFYRRHNKAHRR